MNLYHYAGNNPIKYVDPNGKWGEDVHYSKTLDWLTETEIVDYDMAKAIAEYDNGTDSGWNNRMDADNPDVETQRIRDTETATKEYIKRFMEATSCEN